MNPAGFEAVIVCREFLLNAPRIEHIGTHMVKGVFIIGEIIWYGNRTDNGSTTLVKRITILN